MAAGESTPAAPRRTATRDFFFNDLQGHELIRDESCVAAGNGAEVRYLQPRIRLDRLTAHANFTRSTANDDPPGFSPTGSRRPH
jgi:hypothetical protein